MENMELNSENVKITIEFYESINIQYLKDSEDT